MIFGAFAGGGESSSAKKSYMRQIHIERNLHLMTIEKPVKQLKLECSLITFSTDDARGVSQLYDDPLVVTLVISNYLMYRILIDNGSSADILYLPTFEQNGNQVGQTQARPDTVGGIHRRPVAPVGNNQLAYHNRQRRTSSDQSCKFPGGRLSSAYNTILGKPMLNRLRAVTSTYHLLMCFLMDNRVGKLKGIKWLPKNATWNHSKKV